MTKKPQDAEARRKVKPVICYPNETLPVPDLNTYRAARAGARKVDEILVPARDARTFRADAGHFFRISSVEGPVFVCPNYVVFIWLFRR